MSKISDLRQMNAITVALYEKKQRIFQKVVAEEHRLRLEQERLETLWQDGLKPADGTVGMRAIGADILWEGWVGRARTQNNLKLAKVLAIKEYQLDQIRTAYGKVLVVKELIHAAELQCTAKLARDSLTRAINQSLSV